MRRLMLTVALILTSIALGGSMAGAADPTVVLAWSSAGVHPGTQAELEIRLVGEVSGLYGTTIDIYYDGAVLTPLLGGATTAHGLLNLPGTEPPQSFSDISTAYQNSPPRISLISFRMGDDPGITDSAINGLLGRVSFQVNATAGSSLSFSSEGANVAEPGVVWTRLINNQGHAIGVVLGGPASIYVYGQPSIAFSNAPNPVVTDPQLNVSGTATNVPAGTTVNISLNGNIVTSTTTNAGGAFAVSLSEVLSGLGDGGHILQAGVTSGDLSASASLPFVVDYVGPTVTINTSIPDVYGPTAITLTGTYAEVTVQSIAVAVGAGGFFNVDSFSAGNWSAARSVSPGSVIQVKIISSGGREQIAAMVVPAVELSIAAHPFTSMGQPVEVFAILKGEYQEIRKVVVELRYDSRLTAPTNARLADGLAGTITAVPSNGGLVVVTATLSAPIPGGFTQAPLFGIDFTPVSTGSSILQVGTASVSSQTDGILFESATGAVIPNRRPFFVTLNIENTGSVAGTITLGSKVSSDHGMTWVEVINHMYDGSEVRVGAYTNADGSVNIPGVLPGTYNVWVRHFRVNPLTQEIEPHRYLAVMVTNVQVQANGSVQLPANIELVPGNTIDNEISHDTVFLEDLLVVTRAYGSVAGASNWDERADLNGDGSVDVKDVELLAAAWAKRGAASANPDPEFIR